MKAGLTFNDLVASGKVYAPIVIGRDHLDTGSVASPYRETEAMKDGSDAIADWPILNALVNTASGASWVSFHHGRSRNRLQPARGHGDRAVIHPIFNLIRSLLRQIVILRPIAAKRDAHIQSLRGIVGVPDIS